jgi:phosphonate transport system substrate-binding protein
MRAISALLAALALAGCGDEGNGRVQSDPDTLRVALLPDEAASTIIKKNEPLKRLLERRLGKDVELVVTTDYSSMIEAARRGRVELAYFGPLSYVLAQERADIEPFAALREVRGGPPTYRAVLLASPDAGIDSLRDVRGKQVVYGDVSSTSSHLVPEGILADAGLRAKKDYRQEFAGSSDAVALAVQNGHADFAGMSKPIFESLVERGTIERSRFKVLGESEPIPNYPWVMQAGLDPGLKRRIRSLFLELSDPAVLEAYGGAGFAPIDDHAYDGLRERARELGYRLEELGR